MKRGIKLSGLFCIFMLFLVSLAFSDERTFTISTYYPSPYGSYKELTAQKMRIGITYSAPGVNIADNNLIVQGRVGIGTTAPAAKLNIKCSGNNFEDGFAIEDDSTNNQFQFLHWTPGLLIGGYNNDTSIFNINSNGNIGIGSFSGIMSSPNKLTITGVGGPYQNRTTNELVQLYNSNNIVQQMFGGTNAAFALRYNGTSGLSSMRRLSIVTGVGSGDGSGGTEVFSIYNNGSFGLSGNVGIGTTAPAVQLQVMGTSSIGGSGDDRGPLNIYAPKNSNDDYIYWRQNGDSGVFEYHTFMQALIGHNARINFKIGTPSGGVGNTFGIESGDTVFSPSAHFTVPNGAICVDNDGNCGSFTPGVVRADDFITAGGDFAEWFEKEEDTQPGDLIGINLETGKARKYRYKDKFIGIHTDNPGFAGNTIDGTTEEINRSYVLVGLIGQLPFNKLQVIIKNRIVKTKDGQVIGVLLSNGRVLIGI